MKKFYTFFLLMFSGLLIIANPVDVKLARKVALNYLSAKKGAVIDTFDIQLHSTYKHANNDALHIFTYGKKGFIIVSADDEAKPIIGWSLENPMPKKIDNPVVLGRLEWYAKQINYAAKNKIGGKATKQEWQDILEGRISKGVKAGGPLLTTIWNQEPYYNKFCPTGTPTGCVATAMSQIMRYHQWPTNGKNWHKYVHPTYGTQYANFESTTYDWINMPDELTSQSSQTEIDAVATLCYQAGVSVNMNYATDGSGAFSPDVLYALTNYFNYDPTTIQIYEFDPNNETEWINMVKAEIDAGRPIYYAGSSQASDGHAWVCDGYNDNNELHINWGWGSYAIGYYAASAMKPTNSGYDFSESNEMIIGIQPNALEYKHLWVRQASGFPTSSRGIQFISAVSNRVAWAVAYDGSGTGSQVREFTKTTDAGATWIPGLINPDGATGMAAAMICAISDSIAWVPLYGSNGGGMIAKTEDGGITWTKVTSSDQFDASAGGFPNVVHFWDKNNGFAMGDPTNGYFEIYTTTDGGNNWSRVNQSNIPSPLPEEYGVIGHYATINDTVWFSTNKGRIYRSVDKGYNWQAFQTPFTSTSFELAFKNGFEGFIYAKENELDKFYKTTDGGENWTEINPTGAVYTADFCWIPGTDTLISTGINYQEPNKMGVSYSIDGGNTFIDFAPFYKNFQFGNIGASPEGAVWAGSFNSSSTYGGMWHKGGTVVSADFTINKTSGFTNDSSIIFTDNSYGNPDYWEWNFGEGAEPSTKVGQGPFTVKYTTKGYKTVALTIKKGDDIHVIVKENVLFINWPTGIDTEYSNSKYSVYPNPTNSSVIVNINGFTKGKIDIYNITGALVWSSGAITNDGRIDVSNLNPGVYLIRIQDEKGKIATKKLTISH